MLRLQDKNSLRKIKCLKYGKHRNRNIEIQKYRKQKNRKHRKHIKQGQFKQDMFWRINKISYGLQQRETEDIKYKMQEFQDGIL